MKQNINSDPVMDLLMTLYAGETHILQVSDKISKRLVNMMPGEKKLIRNKVRSLSKLLEAMEKALED